MSQVKFDLPFTGERVVPGKVPEDLERIHRLRYAFAVQWGSIGVSEFPETLVLDAPTGTGYGADMMASAGAMVYGVDCDEGAIRYAKDHYGRQPIRHKGVMDLDGSGEGNGCSFVETSILSVGGAAESGFIPKANFDLVTCFEGIEHVEEEEGRFWIEIFFALLRPGGVLLISSPNPKSSKSGGGKFHKCEYKPTELRALVESYGFRVDSSNCFQQSRNPSLSMLRAINRASLMYWDDDDMIGFTIIRGIKP